MGLNGLARNMAELETLGTRKAADKTAELLEQLLQQQRITNALLWASLSAEQRAEYTAHT